MLINCPKCNRKTREEDASCNNCGHHLTEADRKSGKEAAIKNMAAGYGCLSLILIVVGLILLVAGLSTDGEPAAERNDESLLETPMMSDTVSLILGIVALSGAAYLIYLSLWLRKKLRHVDRAT
ncbi:MAG: hypothetical protein ACYTG7_12275 [Planctomycetota bacterium]|jgi:uncharacterized paraquat-inducible protein A